MLNKIVVCYLMWFNFKINFYKQLYFLFFYRTTFIKCRFFRKFRRKFRKYLKRKFTFLLFFCKPNFLIHSKYKNARMGKGKGTPQRWVYKPIMNKPFAIIGEYEYKRVYAISRYFKKYLSKYIFIKKKVF